MSSYAGTCRLHATIPIIIEPANDARGANVPPRASLQSKRRRKTDTPKPIPYLFKVTFRAGLVAMSSWPRKMTLEALAGMVKEGFNHTVSKAELAEVTTRLAGIDTLVSGCDSSRL